MEKRIRDMVDAIFSDMKMTAENLALRDELMANALSRYEDAVSQGRSEEQILEEVASSLEDVRGLLEETGQDAPHADLGDALGKAFSALGDFSQAIVPEAKKLAREMDDAAGGMFSRLGRAAKKGMRDAQKAAGSAIDRLSRERGELMFDFGAHKQEDEAEFVSEFDMGTDAEPKEEAKERMPEENADVLREQAKDVRAQAALKDVSGDREGAQALFDMADEMENCAQALEQAAMLERAVKTQETEACGDEAQ